MSQFLNTKEKESFFKSIRLVEVEIHSYCNRVCTWCPNKSIDRTNKKILSEKIYTKLLYELKEYGFEGYISFSRYNEPMSDIGLLKRRLRQARDILPNTKLVANTNGDYLTRDSLIDLPIDELTIMDYDCIGIEKAIKTLTEIGVEIHKIVDSFIYAKFNEIDILYYVDWTKSANIEDRGGSLKEFSTVRRNTPCLEPKYFIAIDYNGKVMPCCHMRSDNPEHEKYAIGNLNDSSIYEIYHCEKAKKIRKSAFMLDFDYLKPCTYCQKKIGRYTRKNPGIHY